MKDKFIIFILGLLLGATLATGSIYVYTLITKDNTTSEQSNMQMPGNNNMGGNPPSMPNDNNFQNGQNGPMNNNQTSN